MDPQSKFSCLIWPQIKFLKFNGGVKRQQNFVYNNYFHLLFNTVEKYQKINKIRLIFFLLQNKWQKYVVSAVKIQVLIILSIDSSRIFSPRTRIPFRKYLLRTTRETYMLPGK